MNAGVDFGATLVKAAWMQDGKYSFLSSADCSLERIAASLRNSGVDSIISVGIGKSKHMPAFSDFKVRSPEGDPIMTEIQLQAEGAKIVLELDGYLSRSFLLAAIGTGTSYALVDGDAVKKFPLGNSLGGGFIAGVGIAFGAKDYAEIASESCKGKPLDLLIQDLLPQKKGTFEGALAIANFGRARQGVSPADVYASAISTVAVAIARDVFLISLAPDFGGVQDAVFVGSTANRAPLLKKILAEYASSFGRNAIFPKQGEYALAMGAYHAFS